MDFSETIEIKVVEGLNASEELSVDSYFFAYFHDLPAALEQIRDAIATYSLRTRREMDGEAEGETEQMHMLIDTTSARSPPSSNRNSRVVESSSSEMGLGVGSGQQSGGVASKTSSPFRLASLLRPFQDPATPVPPQTPRTISAPIVEAANAVTATANVSVAPELDTSEEFTHVRKRSSQSFIPITSSPSGTEFPPLASPPPLSGSPGPGSGLPQSSDPALQSVGSLTPTPSTVGVGGGLGLTTGAPMGHPHPHGHTYPPATTPDAINMPPVGGSFMSTSSSGFSSSNNGGVAGSGGGGSGGGSGMRPSPSVWSVGVPSWLKIPSRKSLASPFGSIGSIGGSSTSPPRAVTMPAGAGDGKGVSEVYESTGGGGGGQLGGSMLGGGGGGGAQDMTFSILETPDWEVEAEMAGKFRVDFAFDERERLLGCECSPFLSSDSVRGS